MEISTSPKVEQMVADIMTVYNKEHPTSFEGLQVAMSVVVSVLATMPEPHVAIDAVAASVKQMRSMFPANGNRVQ